MEIDRRPDSQPVGMLVAIWAARVWAACEHARKERADHAGAPENEGATFPAFAAGTCSPVETALTCDAGRASQPPSRSAVTLLDGVDETGAEPGENPRPEVPALEARAGEGIGDGTIPAKIGSGWAQ